MGVKIAIARHLNIFVNKNERPTLIYNFSASHVGGGLKRLVAYLEWFSKYNINYNAVFIINTRVQHLKFQYPQITIYCIKPSSLERLFNDHSTISDIIQKYPNPLLYFAYGIPVYRKIAKINWFHLSNLLPFKLKFANFFSLELSKMFLLRKRIKDMAKNVDIFSAESKHALFIAGEQCIHPSTIKYHLPNGIDLNLISPSPSSNYNESYAVAIGTKKYKAIKKTIEIFMSLQNKNELSRLIIIGSKKDILMPPPSKQNIEFINELPLEAIYELLSNAKYYISSSKVENSPNAVLEAALLSQNCLISDIPAHREIADALNITLKEIDFHGLPYLQFSKPTKEMVMKAKTKIWGDIIQDQLNFINKTSDARIKD